MPGRVAGRELSTSGTWPGDCRSRKRNDHIPTKSTRSGDLGAETRWYDEPLTEALERLDAAQTALRREERELEATLMLKNRVMAAHDMRFLTIARALESLFRLAGFEELADRVRPSSRRPGYVENEPEAPAAPGGDTPLVEISSDPGATTPAAS